MFNDLYVDTDGLIYVPSIKGGLYVLEYNGAEDSVIIRATKKRRPTRNFVDFCRAPVFLPLAGKIKMGVIRHC